MRTVIAVFLLFVPLSLAADDPHSHHDHGAPDLGNIGKAHLDTSCNEAAQKEIDRGVTLIHSFWYAAADKAKAVSAKTDREKAFIRAIHTFYSGADKLDHRTRMAAYEKAMAELDS